MRFIVIILLLSCQVFCAPTTHEIQLDDGSSLVYYIESPETSHPLLIAIEGSYVQSKGPESVLRLHHQLSQPILETGSGIVTLERRGVDGDHFDETRFHSHNTPSQRLADHRMLIEHLKSASIENWNGQFIILGGSEGGPIATKLAYTIDPLACIAIVGCSDQAFKEMIWTHMQSNADPETAISRSEFNEFCEMVKLNPDPNQWMYGQTFLYWADALDQTVSEEFLGLKCPALVITGTEDIECPATDRLIAKARQNNQDVTYLRIEGMDHSALDPKWKVLEKIQEFLLALTAQPM